MTNKEGAFCVIFYSILESVIFYFRKRNLGLDNDDSLLYIDDHERFVNITGILSSLADFFITSARL